MFCAPVLFFVGTGSQVPFLCFSLPDSVAAVPRALGPFFMFSATRLIFSSIEGIGSRFHVLRSRTRFRRHRQRRVPFSCFALLDPFSLDPSALCPVFGGTDGVGYRFYVLRSRTRFRRYRWRRVSFSCFALPDPSSAIPTASGPVFMFYATGAVFVSTERVMSCFHVLRSRTLFRW
jgi:hypothetical protein